jgi:hypothetical protein
VVVTHKDLLLGYEGPTGSTNVQAMNAAPFLRRVFLTPSASVYRVVGAHAPPVSPLLRGPVLHCIRTRVHF